MSSTAVKYKGFSNDISFHEKSLCFLDRSLADERSPAATYNLGMRFGNGDKT
jgi:hypothetical protein